MNNALTATTPFGHHPVIKVAYSGLIAQGRRLGLEEPFSQQVVRILNDRELARRLGEEGRVYVHEWSAGSMAQRMGFLYEQTADEALAVWDADRSSE